MTKRKYQIIIHTSRTDGVHTEKNNVAYPQMSKASVGDTIKVFTQKIEIQAERNGKFDIEDIIEYKQSTIYTQIYKSLLYLFLKKGKRVNIRSIDVRRIDYFQPLPIDAKRQPLVGDFSIRFAIPEAVLDNLWEEGVKGNTMRAAVSHFLVALSSNDRYIRFERLWRAFEQIAMWNYYHDAMPNKPKEFEALVNMRNHICSNPIELSNTFAYVDTLDNTRIESLHWRKLIQNNYTCANKVRQVRELYDDFFDKNKDERLVGVFKKALKMQEKEINNQGRMVDFETLISDYSNNHIRNNSHVLSLLVCKYCYFMRNKMFHGEVADFSFCFTNHTEDDDITDFLNELLERLVNELICEYNKL